MSKIKTIAAPTRRQILGTLAGTTAAAWASRVWAAAPSLTFEELYGKVGVLGLEFSAKVNALKGRTH